MRITDGGRNKLVLDNRIHIYGVNHFSSDTLNKYVDYLEETQPDLIAVEDYDTKFLHTQIQLAMQEVNSEVGISLAYSLRESIPIALIDKDWSDIELNEDGIYTEVISNALSEKGLTEPKGDEVSIRDFDEYNNAIAEYNLSFYRDFIPEREITMAKHLVWIINKRNEKTILVPVGIAHVKNIYEYLLDIYEGNSYTKPESPPIYSSEELTNFTQEKDTILDEMSHQPIINTHEEVAELRKRYKSQAMALKNENEHKTNY